MKAEADMEISEIIRKAVDEARRTMSEGKGGPFGAAIIDPEGMIYVSSNTVLGSADPTAHAEVNAIRKACRERGSHDLTGCVLYTTCYPCPMCLGAAIWANIKEVYYGADSLDAAAIGFRDDYIYDYIRGGCRNPGVLKLEQVAQNTECKKLFGEYAEAEKQMY